MTLVAIAIALSFPVVKAMRSAVLSPGFGIALIAATLLLVLGPWFYSERRSRRMMKELREEDNRTAGDR